MPLIAECSFPTESFLLAETLPAFPDTVVEVDRIAAHVPDSAMPCLWVSGGDIHEFVDALADEPTVESVPAKSELDGELLLYVEWSDEMMKLIGQMIHHATVILEASGRRDRWTLRIRFMTRDQFDGFRSFFDHHELVFQLERIFEERYPHLTRVDITPRQYEALRLASERGFFNVPRDVSIQQIADEIGISHQAVSERLRRGTKNLVQDMLTAEPMHRRRSESIQQ
jgi:predicted DNA binding protein